MMDGQVWDVVVVGGGPGGAIAAKKLAERKLKTLLVEKRELPRHKTCGGFVSVDAQLLIRSEFGVDVPAILHCKPENFRGVRVVASARSKQFFEVNLGHQAALSVWRKDFDFWLVVKANEHGATVWDECSVHRISEVVEQSGEKLLELRLKRKADNGRTYDSVVIRTRYIVGADGGGSVVRGFVYPETRQPVNATSYQEYIEGTVDLDPRYYYYFIDRQIARGTTWFTQKDGLISIGMGYYRGTDFEAYRNSVIHFFETTYNLKIHKVVRKEGCVEVVERNLEKLKQGNLHYYLGRDEYNVVLIGDAAEVIDLYGEGIHNAMRTGQLAAEAIVMHRESGGARPLARLYAEHAAEFVENLKARWWEFYRKSARFLYGVK